MKSIKIISIILIIVIIAGIVASGFGSRMTASNTIVVHAMGNISSDDLTRSVSIISARLKSAGTGKFEIKQTGKGNIEINPGDGWDINLVKKLATKQGALAFYETLDKNSYASEKTKDERLLSLLHGDENITSIGCVPAADAGKVNDYLNSLQQNTSYSFAWSQIDESNTRCLYALKLNTNGKPLLKGTDVSSIQTERGASDHDYAIGIRFKDSAVKEWAAITQRNMNKAIAITVDKEVFYAPIVKSPMNNGLCQLTGNFSEVSYFVALAGHGELPVKFEVVR